MKKLFLLSTLFSVHFMDSMIIQAGSITRITRHDNEQCETYVAHLTNETQVHATHDYRDGNISCFLSKTPNNNISYVISSLMDSQNFSNFKKWYNAGTFLALD